MMDNTYSVYVHECPNGKRYVGITKKRPEERWANGKGYREQVFGRAVRKYGWDNIDHNVIAYNLTEDEAKELEVQMISLFDTMNPKHGYNRTSGGDGAPGVIRNEEQRKASSEHAKKMWEDEATRARLLQHLTELGEKNRGRKMPRETVEKIIASLSIKVTAYGKDFTPVATYDSLMDAAMAMGANANSLISRCCKIKEHTAYGFYWRYADDPITEKEAEELSKPKPPKNAKEIVQYDLNYNEVARYESLHEAERMTGYSFKSIHGCVSRKLRMAFGYIWRYSDDSITEDDKARCEKPRLVAVEQYTKGMEYIQTHESVSEAARSVNGLKNCISRAANGGRPSAYGYVWRFVS